MEKFINVNGIDICYDDWGEGKPLILIHGLMSDKESMVPFAEILGEGRRYINVDVRGHGKSVTDQPYTLDTHSDDLAALIRALFPEAPKPDVVGLSMGSYIGHAFAQKYSDLIDHLILVCTKPSGITSSVERIVTDAGYDMASISQEKLLELMLGVSLAPRTKERIADGSFDAAQLEPTSEMSEEATRLESESLANFDLSAGYDLVTCKTLVIAGEHDGLNLPEWGKEVADGIGCEFIVIPDAGHMVHLENPDALGEEMSTFLAS